MSFRSGPSIPKSSSYPALTSAKTSSTSAQRERTEERGRRWIGGLGIKGEEVGEGDGVGDGSVVFPSFSSKTSSETIGVYTLGSTSLV